MLPVPRSPGLSGNSLQCFCSSPCLSQGNGPLCVHWRSNWKDPELGGWEQHFVNQAEQGQPSHLSSSLLIRTQVTVVVLSWWNCSGRIRRCQWRWALRSQKPSQFPDSCRSVSYWGPFLICWKHDCSLLRTQMRLALFCSGVYPSDQSMKQGALLSALGWEVGYRLGWIFFGFQKLLPFSLCFVQWSISSAWEPATTAILTLPLCLDRSIRAIIRSLSSISVGTGAA